MWGFIKNNSIEIQTISSILGLLFTIIGIIIAIVAIWYANKQIKLSLAQRRFELKLLIQQQLDMQLNTARKIKSDIGELKKIHNRKMKQGFNDEKLNQAYKNILPPMEVVNDYVESIIKVLELSYQFLIHDENKLSIKNYEEQVSGLLKSGQGLQKQSMVVDKIKLSVTGLAGKDL